MLTDREHDLIVALKKLIEVTVQIPVNFQDPDAKEMCVRATAAVNHAQALVKRIEPV